MQIAMNTMVLRVTIARVGDVIDLAADVVKATGFGWLEGARRKQLFNKAKETWLTTHTVVIAIHKNSPSTQIQIGLCTSRRQYLYSPKLRKRQ